jgi:hypothetical protein
MSVASDQCIIDRVPDPTEPVVQPVTFTAEGMAGPAVPYSLRPDLLEREAAAKEVAPMLVGMTVAEARAKVEQEAKQRGLRLRIEFHVAAGRPQTGDRAYGRIRAGTRGGVVVTASG